MNKQELWDNFGRTFRDFDLESGIYKAPGRVNLIGEHTDYNDGFVMPMAIEKEITMLAQLRPDRKVKFYSLDYDQMVEYNLDSLEYDEENIWANYIMGVIDEIQKLGSSLQGFNLMFTGNIPQGSGLSSSAALEVVTAMTVVDLHKIKIDGIEMALLAQRAENNFVGVQCGIMDQYISRLGQKGHALLIDCRTNDYQLVPFKDENYQIVICNSRVERGLVDSKYNERRSECEQAVEFFAEKEASEITALRDLDLETVEKYKDELAENVYKRAHHVVSENARVIESQKALEADELKKFGDLMYASHKSLSEDYEVSCEELDILVSLAAEAGVEGARMTGAGFGGCTVNLVKKDRTEQFIKIIKEKYKKETDIDAEVYISNPAAGARKI
ncbi:galactokinase [Halanaerobium saccharolyticum]|uniref:Galactokinase n=1 Tax=Halanaerobium saccharolyticum TaxID=43595 RepID=A0A4R7Z1A9_9FIRM|nr:galactokinase [Halanaerobium saccharolyticum]RAK07851.1 galactokinase [Halanaerobium saccharolyticum]TDW04465.1 galactokinase [Halanaerobium saccharolyticum]TDX59801.1 galactokinase [Halanaerobium saccharolyticum]